MDPLEWYDRMDAAHQQSAYALAWHLCHSKETAVRRIIPAAVEIACNNIRNRDRRERDSPTGWKIRLSDPQSLQIGILEAARRVLEAAERKGAVPQTDPWLAYVAHLTLCTLPRNSFDVAVGFGRFLTNGSIQDVLSLYDFLDPCGRTGRDPRAVNRALHGIEQQMAQRFPKLALTEIPLTEIPKEPDDARHHVLAAMVPWESRHLPDTYAAFSAVQEARRTTIVAGLGAPPGWLRGRRRRSAAERAKAAVEIDRAHVCLCQQRCLERGQQWWGRQTAFTMWRIPNQAGMNQAPNVGPWPPPTGADWDRINEAIMREILWRQWWAGRRGHGRGATLEVRVDDQVQAVITPARRDAVTLSLPAAARYVEIQDREHQTVVATCHLMDPHDLPPGGWQRAVPLPAGGRLRVAFSADPDPETEETGLRMTVGASPPWWSIPWGDRVPPRGAPIRSRWAPGWVTGAVMGLPLLAMGVVLTLWLSTSQATPQVTMAVSLSHRELLGLERGVKRQLEDTLGATLVLQPIDPSILVPTLERMVATHTTIPWDLISVDNDTLGILVQKGLVQDLSQYRPYEQLIPGTLLDPLKQLEPRVDGRYHFVPFRPNIKLMYYNQDLLSQAGHNQPPTTWEALAQLAHDLASADLGSQGRVAIQAHPGKAAAVTVFEWVRSLGGDPLTLADAGARQAFTRLWNLAPDLAPESTRIQFDTANNMLITNKVSVVDNWTYGIKVVMETFEKTHIKVTPGLRGSAHVLGGDVLAIPQGAPHPERAIQLIEQLLAKPTQHTLATELFWAPVREDVYAELSAQTHFQVIRDALRDPGVVTRPTTPGWVVAEEVLSDALQEVLRQGREQGAPATDADIDALLRPYVARLQEIPREYIPCAVVREKTARDGRCELEVPTEKSFKDLAHDFKTTPAMLAKVNGRDELEPVSPKTMHILLMPKN